MEENPKHSAEWLEMKTELTSTDKQEREWSDDERLKKISAVAFCLRREEKCFGVDQQIAKRRRRREELIIESN